MRLTFTHTPGFPRAPLPEAVLGIGCEQGTDDAFASAGGGGGVGRERGQRVTESVLDHQESWRGEEIPDTGASKGLQFSGLGKV